MGIIERGLKNIAHAMSDKGHAVIVARADYIPRTGRLRGRRAGNEQRIGFSEDWSERGYS